MSKNILQLCPKRACKKHIGDSYAFSVNEILKDMFGFYMRPAIIEDLIEEFEKGMDREDYSSAKKALMNLSQLLGEKHPNVVALQTEYNIEAEE